MKVQHVLGLADKPNGVNWKGDTVGIANFHSPMIKQVHTGTAS